MQRAGVQALVSIAAGIARAPGANMRTTTILLASVFSICLAVAGCGGGGGGETKPPGCDSGAACEPENACHVGTTACGTGSAVCQDTQALVATGTRCGDASVCNAGACVACAAGTVCRPGEGSCHVGAVDCSTGVAVCKDTGKNVDPGVDCGVNHFCAAAGDCHACTLEKLCKDGIAPCHAGAIACDSGAPVCKDAGPLPEGTGCTDGAISGYCAAGVCTPCAGEGAACGGGGHCTADGKCVLTVSGSAQITYWPEGGSPVDLGNCFGQRAEVLTPNGDGGYTPLVPTNGVCTETNGTFTIPEPVPAGAYLLHFASTAAYGNLYLETTRSTLDFGRDQAGRPDSNIVADNSVQVTFASSGLDPWTPGGDTLEFACGNVGAQFSVASSAFGLTDLAAGATSGAATVDWKAQPLIDPAKGDIAWLYQMAAKSKGDGKGYLTVTKAAGLEGFQVTADAPATATAALSTVSQTGTLSLTWATDQFEALAVKANPAYSVGAHFISVDAVQLPSNSAKFAPASAHLRLFSASAQPGQAALDFGTVAYGRFLGDPWREVLSTRFDMHADYMAPGASKAATTYVGIYQQDPLPLPAGAIVAPRLGPPRRPLVGGWDATVPQSGVTTTAELSWLAPSQGTPDAYAVELNELTLDADGQTTQVATVASFRTRNARILVPDGVLVAGHAYFAVIAALETPDVAYDMSPLRQGLSTVRAETATAIFTP